ISDMTSPEGYYFLEKLSKSKACESTCFMTINYDLGLDLALFRATSVQPFYGFGGPLPGSTTILKLHGSVNWHATNGAPGIEATPVDQFLTTTCVEYDPSRNESRLLISKKLENLGEIPFIVPPSWRKGDHYSGIAPVWTLAAEH